MATHFRKIQSSMVTTHQVTHFVNLSSIFPNANEERGSVKVSNRGCKIEL